MQDEPPPPADLLDDDGGRDVMPGPEDPGWDDPSPQRPAAGPQFDDTDPSGWLALELDTGTADPGRYSEKDLVAAVVGFDRLASWAQARQAQLLAELAQRAARPGSSHTATGLARTSLDGEIAVALTLSMGSAQARLAQARRLVSALPATLALWQAGRIDRPKVHAVVDATATVSAELTGTVEARVLPAAPQQSLGQLRAALARAILAVDPEGANQRHRQARTHRRVVLGDQAEAMASLWALLAAHDAQAAFRWLTRLARALGADDPRSMDERRADLLAELLSGRLITTADVAVTDENPDTTVPDDAAENDAGGGEPDEAGPTEQQADEGQPATRRRDSATSGETTTPATGTASTGTATGTATGTSSRRGSSLRPVTPGKPLIEVVMAHTTLTGADDQPAELVGYGPIPACLAREIAADAVWRRLVTDPFSGALLDYGRTTYRPPAALADFVRARDRYCRGPLCRQSAANCELDHFQPWAQGGTTSQDNLNAFCGREHKLKDAPDWRIELHPDGRLTWTTPTGQQLTTERYDYRPETGPDPPPTPGPKPRPEPKKTSPG